jgi:RNA polymerase sigma factor (sigma-70 family)
MCDIGSSRLLEQRLQLLLCAGLKGDAVSYRSFLHDLRIHLGRFLRRRLSRADGDVEDILQEVLLAVHRARHTYRPDRPLTAWAHAIARYKLVDFFRARARGAAFHISLERDWHPAVTLDCEWADASRDVGQLLDNLPDRYRLPILHTKLRGLSVTETAVLTGLTESAVKMGVHRGMKRLIAAI